MEEWSKTLPEDTVEYAIYAFPQKNRLGPTSKSAAKEILKEARKFATQLIDQHLKGYIWQRESFSLSLRDDGKDTAGKVCHLTFSRPDTTDNSIAGEVHLHGRTNFGDSIEDEWLIVWLLRELSKQFPQLWIKVTDSMGEFLLVEAANVLPAWIDPEIADNRVWLNKGELRLMPLASRSKGSDQPSPPPAPLTIADARQHIYDEKQTLHPDLVEKEAFHRLRDYPTQIQRNQHHALITIPRRLAYLLHESPSYVSSAVDAFYLRDPIAMKPLVASNPKGLNFPPEDFTTMRVKFTRVGYAQIKSQRFEAPASWEAADRGYDDARFRGRAETGMKITAGFEMLLNDPQRQDERLVREMKMLLGDVDSGEVELPTNKEIETWGMEADGEEWMDIDFRDFEDELAGRRGPTAGSTGGKRGFGDKAAQENLRKMVSRFEDFLRDDTLGPDDVDDGSDEDEESAEDVDSDGENRNDKSIEEDFTKMMRELMDMPEDVMHEIMTGNMSEDEIKRFAEQGRMRDDKTAAVNDKGKGKVQIEDDDDQIEEFSAAMERELRSIGALDVSDPQKRQTFNRISSATITPDERLDDDEDDNELLDEDYNLVANMLESFKSQAGVSGPGGNLMNMLGVQIPRDEAGGEDDNEVTPPNQKHLT